MDRTSGLVLILCMLMCTVIAVVGMVLDHEKKKARKAAEPSRPPAPFRTSVLAGFSFVSGLIAVLLVITSSILSACVSMNEIARIQEPVQAPLELAAKIVLYCSILPAVGAVALALGARGSISESRETLGGRSLYRTGLFLAILSGVLVLDAKVVNPANWVTLGSPGGAGGAGGVIVAEAGKADPNKGYLGVEHEPVAGSDGIRILRVLPGTPAERAGLKPGDRIIQIDDVPVVPGESFADRIGSLKPGTSVEISLRRNNNTIRVTAVLAATFASLLELLGDCVGDGERITVLQTAGAGRRFTGEELKQVCETFNADREREEAVTQLLPQVVDPENAYQVRTTFHTLGSRDRVSRKILERIQSK